MRPAQHTPNTVKLSRAMTAWQYGVDEFPQDILGWIIALDNGMFTVVSPNTGHSTVFDWDWYIIQTEVGCLYAIPPQEFAKKYRLVD